MSREMKGIENAQSPNVTVSYQSEHVMSTFVDIPFVIIMIS